MQGGSAKLLAIAPQTRTAPRCSGTAGCAFTNAAAAARCQDAVLALNENGDLHSVTRASAAQLWVTPVVMEDLWPGAYKDGAWTAALAVVDSGNVAVVAVQTRSGVDSADELRLAGVAVTNGTMLWQRCASCTCKIKCKHCASEIDSSIQSSALVFCECASCWR